MNRSILLFLLMFSLAEITFSGHSAQGEEETPSASLLTKSGNRPVLNSEGNPVTGPRHALRSVSLFAIPKPEPPTFQVHDLIQIVVRETSRAKSTQDRETKKDWKLEGKIPAWPDLTLTDLLNLYIPAGRTTNTPSLKMDVTKDFTGEGEYERKDDLTARVTAEVIEVLPNGNIVLEARTTVQTDEEINTIQVTGTCRPEDVTASNTVQSHQIHNLVIRKMHEGELKEVTERGLIAKVLDFIFAF